MDFKLVSDYAPTGDQPEAIAQLLASIRHGSKHNTLLGVTGSGKTFTVANVISQLNRPTLVLSHNKTLAAQLYGEFKNFFPENAVEYFVSYYDYYQPEAYLPSTDTYIEKDLSINDEIEKMRLSTTATLLSGRRDVIVVSSVSCLYGCGNPSDFHSMAIHIEVGEILNYKQFLYKLVEALYTRTERELTPATFRVTGDTIDIMAAFGEFGNQCFRVTFFDNEVESIQSIDPVTGQRIQTLDALTLYPVSLFVTTKERIHTAVQQIYLDLGKQIAFFEQAGRPAEAQRIKQRVEYDLEMIKELGYCPGIENYSRYFDGRAEGTRPFCLLDYFPQDYLMVIDESHVTLPQVHAMFGGDRARKENLVEYGFRLPAAKDNRPLRFEEFEQLVGTTIYVSATPADYELMKSEGVIVEQLIRPTGLVDPPLEVRITDNQIDDLLEEIDDRLDDDMVLWAKLHRLNHQQLQLGHLRHIVAFPQGLDTYDVLNAADVLVSDYSSVLFDFACTRRKIVLFCYDYRQYVRQRGCYFDPAQLPFPLCTDVDSLVDALRSPDGWEDAAFVQRFVAHDSLHACRNLCAHIFGGPQLHEVRQPVDPARRVLCFVGELNKGKETDALFHYLRETFGADRCFITYMNHLFKTHYERLWQFPFACQVPMYMYQGYYAHFLPQERIALEKIRRSIAEGKEVDAAAEETLAEQGRREYRRYLYETTYDRFVRCGGLDIESLKWFAVYPKEKWLSLPENMLEKAGRHPEYC